MSGKHRKGLEYKAQGVDIDIIDADTFSRCSVINASRALTERTVVFATQ